MSNTVAIIQARMSSIRLPGKSLKMISGKPNILRVIERIKRSEKINDLWVACSNKESDNILYDYIKSIGINCFRGSMNDVLSRYLEVSKLSKADNIVRITGDCPLIDPTIIDKVIEKYFIDKTDYTSNTIHRTFPDGLDVEVFSYDALREADKFSKISFMREHVTPYIHGKLEKKIPSGNFKRSQLINSYDYSKHRWTLDQKEDLQFIESIYNKLNDLCSWLEVIELINRNPNLTKVNSHIKHNEGSKLKDY